MTFQALPEAIQRQNNIKRAVLNSFSASDSAQIEKGEIMSQFGYGYGSGNKMTFKKTGAWLKANIPSVIARLSVLQGDIEGKLELLEEQIGFEPTEVQGSYNIKTISLKRYPYEKLYSSKKETATIGAVTLYGEETVDTSDTTCQKCRQYNDLCYTLISVLEDIECCKVIVANVEDKQGYDMTVSQLVSLAINDGIEKGEISEDDETADELIKAEGSRGGKVIGHTKSGKPVYAGKNASEYKNFDKQDHVDAQNLHSTEAKKHWKKAGDDEDSEHNDFAEHHDEIASTHRQHSKKGKK